ncbi:ParA family protein (plasmid) [Herbiconiux sp. KACC 21604]|uniref:ParA family protein n=1 Tax=unclassified Herbiconiux TaxID=2618217 RepID=UPI0014908EB4|nr:MULTISPECIES: ParA family protein [unclassified Herbiconiux]QJU56288.1 ParA family protein [Herbiconiux sp. SALV-R1]WPO88792.1 ParA family protein [Herbiconiux sp. KACC 21604]
MTQVTAVGNRKGGVGKTSVTLGLAQGLALLGREVLLVDVDPQADLTDTLGVEGEYNVFDVLYAGEDGTLGQAVVASEWPHIDVVPGSSDVARIDTEQLTAPEQRLKGAIAGAGELAKYDHILIDTPPAIGRLTLNGLIAADTLVVVTEPGRFSVRGVQEYLATVEKVQKASYLNPGLRVGGIVINKFQTNPKTAEQAFQVQQIQETFGELVLDPILPLRTAIPDSQSAGTPLTKVSTRGAMHLVEHFVELARKIERSK